MCHFYSFTFTSRSAFELPRAAWKPSENCQTTSKSPQFSSRIRYKSFKFCRQGQCTQFLFDLTGVLSDLAYNSKTETDLTPNECKLNAKGKGLDEQYWWLYSHLYPVLVIRWFLFFSISRKTILRYKVAAVSYTLISQYAYGWSIMDRILSTYKRIYTVTFSTVGHARWESSLTNQTHHWHLKVLSTLISTCMCWVQAPNQAWFELQGLFVRHISNFSVQTCHREAGSIAGILTHRRLQNIHQRIQLYSFSFITVMFDVLKAIHSDWDILQKGWKSPGISSTLELWH